MCLAHPDLVIHVLVQILVPAFGVPRRVLGLLGSRSWAWIEIVLRLCWSCIDLLLYSPGFCQPDCCLQRHRSEVIVVPEPLVCSMYWFNIPRSCRREGCCQHRWRSLLKWDYIEITLRLNWNYVEILVLISWGRSWCTIPLPHVGATCRRMSACPRHYPECCPSSSESRLEWWSISWRSQRAPIWVHGQLG